MENRALILLASYNGEDYISKQIESIINQSYQNWDLYIRDDGSKDSTVSIVRSFAEHDNRIHLLDKTNRISGACLNFYELLRFAKRRIDDYKYFFLSDQDDLWDSEKLRIEIQELTVEKPLLVYSDLMLMSEDGIISNSRMSDIHDINLKNMNDIFYNQIFIWGNTIGINRELLKLINIPNDISNNLSHDHYLAFYASAFGKIIYINQPLTFYRRHKDNVSELPPNYGIAQVFNRLSKGLRSLIDRHAQSYCNVLFFIDNAPTITTILKDVRNSYIYNSVTAIKVLRKYNIKPGSNKYNILVNYFLLITGAYKFSYIYKNYKKNKFIK